MGLRILGLRHETVKRSLAWSLHAIRDFARLLIYSKVAGTRTAQMKRARLIFSALILIVPIAFLALQAKPSPASVEDEIKDFEQRVNAAYEANDLAEYFSFYAADFFAVLAGRADRPFTVPQRLDCLRRGRESPAKSGDVRHAHPNGAQQGHGCGKLHSACADQIEGWKNHGRGQPGIGCDVQEKRRMESRVFALFHCAEKITRYKKLCAA